MGVSTSYLVGATHAQNPDDQPPDSQPPGGGQAVNEPYTPKVAQQEFDEYYAAIQNCETPSLECLVRYVMRYSAIEWIGEAAGSNNVIQQEADAGFNYGTGSGAITGLFSMIGEFYKHPPAETSVYIADLVESAGFAPPAYAQGLGFASLSPILDLWKMFRNVAYFFFIGAFIVIGFMIMFRYKIAGQTAVTAQQAIPSVIISLVLVTFSYAIAGLLVDLMYLTMFMMLGIFGDLLSNLPQVGGKAFESGVLSANILDVGGALFKGIWDGGLSRNVVSDSLDAVASGNNWLNRQLAIGGGIIISLIITIAVLIGVFKLFFELLKSYFSIVVAVIMSPILLMMGAIPGKNTFTPWLKGIIGNLAAFPTVLLALIMFAKFTEVGTSTGGFMPPFLIGSGAAGMIGPMLGLATILALPEIVKKVKESLGASDGGFAAAIAGAAWDRSKQGTPLGLGASGALIGGGLGAAYGYGRGLVVQRKDLFSQNPDERRDAWKAVRESRARFGGNYLNYGARAGMGLASSLGGSTPGALKPVEGALKAASGVMTESSQLNRLRRPSYDNTSMARWLGSPGSMSETQWENARDLAAAEGARQESYENLMRQNKYAEAAKLVKPSNP